MAMRNIACLPALIGAFRDAAGGMFLSTGGNFPIDQRALSRPDLLGSAHAAHHQHVEHRPRARARRRAPIRALVVYNSNPVAVAPDSRAWSRGLRARGSVHGGARAVPDRHGRLCGHRAAGDHAARAPRRREAVRPLLHGREQSGHPAARGGEAQHGDLPPAGARHGIHRAVLRGFRCEIAQSRVGRGLGFRCGARARVEAHRCDARASRVSPTAAFDTPSGKVEFYSSRRSRRGARSAARLHRAARRHPQRAGAPLSARDDLAAGAPLPQFELRQRREPARRRRRAVARHPSRRRRAARTSPTAATCAYSTTAVSSSCARG